MATTDSDTSALRATVRIHLAFWSAQDRGSITTGPEWLWRGQLLRIPREAELAPAIAEKIARRRAAGMTGWELFAVSGPRQRRLPRWARASTAWWCGIWACALLATTLLCLRDGGDRLTYAVVSGSAATVTVAAGIGVLAMLGWAGCDPLRLSATQWADVKTAQRAVPWNPLADAGKVSPAAAFVLEAVSVCSRLAAHPGWSSPGLEVVRWQFDPAEELFQITRAAWSLDTFDDDCAARSARGAALDAVYVDSSQALREALLERLVALHRCVATLDELLRAPGRGSGPDVAGQLGATAALQSVVESELATASLRDLNANLSAFQELSNLHR